MGNTASVETLPQQPPVLQDARPQLAKRQPQKLSKPRVGNHASSGRTRRMSSSAVSVASSNTQLPLNPNPALRRQSTLVSPVPLSPLPLSSTSTRMSPPNAPLDDLEPAPEPQEADRRLSLFRSKSTHDDRQSWRKSVGPVPPMPGDRRSRADSMNWESEANFEYARRQVESSHNIAGNRQSVNYDMTSYEASRLVSQQESMPPDVESVLSGSNNYDISHETWNGQEEPKEVISRVNSDLSLYAPVRRRSIIQTPGLATRWPGEGGSASRRSSVRYSNPPTPVLTARARLDSLDSGTARIMSLPPPPKLIYPELIQRVETPSDGEYKQLGTMAFGSLRITNGAASPVPSIEGEARPGDEGSRPVSQTRDEVDLTEDAVEPFYTEETVVVAIGRAEEISAPLTPRLVEVGRLSRASSFKKSPGLVPEMPTEAPPQLPQLNDFELPSRAKPKRFRQDMCTGTQPEYSTNEVLDIREDADAKPKLERPTIDHVQHTVRTLARADSGNAATPESEASLKALSKADSGYSSNVSVRSFASINVSGKGDEASNGSAEDSGIDTSAPIPLESLENGVRSTARTKLVVDTATFDLLTAPSPTSMSARLSPISPRTRPPPVSPHSKPPSSPNRSEDQQPVSSVPERRRSGLWSSHSLSTSTRFLRPSSTWGIDGESNNTKSRKNKLQRLLSGASLRGGPPVVTVHPVENSAPDVPDIPDVPQEVEAKLHEHSGRFPTNPRRLTLRRQHSKDTLKAIFGVGSVDAPHRDNIRTSLVVLEEAPAHVAEPSPTKASRRRSIQSAASLISRTSLRRKPVGSGDRHDAQMAQGDLIPNGFESHITSIDSIRNSVGRSAFDSAFSTLPDHDGERDYRGRAMTMDAQMEREMGMHRQPSRGRNPRLATTPSRASPIPELPELSPTLKSKIPPPISLQNRSAKSIRKNPSSRPQSTPPVSKPGSLSRRSSRESVQSSRSGQQDSNVPPVPALDARFPEFQHLRRVEGQDEDTERARRESMPDPPHSNSDSRGRPKSAAPNLLRKQPHQQPPHDLRRQSSYEDYVGRTMSLSRASEAAHYYESRNPTASGSYYHNQLRQLQDEQWGGQGWDEPTRFPPHGPPARHSWNRAGGSRGRTHEPPYRVLHSYNSPAYRNAPIWG